jgi:hypothetical protein
MKSSMTAMWIGIHRRRSPRFIMLRTVKLAVLLVIVSSTSSFISAQSLSTTVVAYSSQETPGSPGETYGTLRAFPRLGTNGHVAFSSVIAGAPAPDDFAYFVGLPGALQVAIRENADGGGPELFDGNGDVGVDANGTISVWTSLALPTDQDDVIYGLMPGGSEVAREGSTVAPGFGGGIFSSVGFAHATNDAGDVAFGASVLGGDAVPNVSASGLFAGSAGHLSLVARTGTAAPGATGTTPVFATLSFDRRINNVGQVGFATRLSGEGVTTSNNFAIYVWTPGEGESGTLALAAQTGNHAPDTSATTAFLQFDTYPSFNNLGEVAFRGRMTGPDIDSSNNYGIWAEPRTT